MNFICRYHNLLLIMANKHVRFEVDSPGASLSVKQPRGNNNRNEDIMGSNNGKINDSIKLYAPGTTFRKTWIIVTEDHQKKMMNKYQVNDWGIPHDFRRFPDIDSYRKAIGGGIWTTLKSLGWQHRYCTDSQTKLQVSIHINPIYKDFITGRSAKFMQG